MTAAGKPTSPLAGRGWPVRMASTYHRRVAGPLERCARLHDIATRTRVRKNRE